MNGIDEFFPTPRGVIHQLIAPVRERLSARDVMVLEPSAGRGDILDVLSDGYGVAKTNLYAVEINPDLRSVLGGKGYRVLDSDFLAFADPYRFDVVVMNPPFSVGVDHLLKAWDVLRPGGVVSCLLNAETVRNPSTEKRKLLARLIAEYGTTTEIGQVFKTAARPTDVEVVLVVLNKPAEEKLNLFDGLDVDTEAPPAETEFSAYPLASRDLLKSLVAQYQGAVAAAVEYHRAAAMVTFYSKPVLDKHDKPPVVVRPLAETLDAIKASFWGYVFRRTRISAVASSRFQGEFAEFQRHHSNMAFSYDNVMAVLELLLSNSEEIMTRCVVDAFDAITKHHANNVVHTDGWKTNKAHMVAQKIIVPYGIEYEQRWDGWSKKHYHDAFWADLDRAVCFITGERYDQLREIDLAAQFEGPQQTIDRAIDTHLNYVRKGADYAVEFESRFFRIRVYKKGTAHLWFKDADVWRRFNQIAARGKGWLGNGE